MARRLGEVTLPNEATARAVERVVDAAMGLPSRGEGVPLGHGKHGPRETLFTWRWAEPTHREGLWRYPYFEETRHLLLRSLLLSESEEERSAIFQAVPEDDEHHTRAAYLSGVFRRVLSDFEPAIYDSLDFLSLAIHREHNEVHVWLRSSMNAPPCRLGLLLKQLDSAALESDPRRKAAVEIMRRLDRASISGTTWHVLPTAIESPAAIRLYAIGIPDAMLAAMQPILRRPEIDSLFGNALQAAVYLCAANVVRYILQPFLTPQEIQGLAPPPLVARILLAALTSNDAEPPPEESLASVFEDVAHRPYEGRAMSGELHIGPENELSIEFRLTNPINYSEPKLVRKVLEANTEALFPVGTTTQLFGFGTARADSRCTRVSFAAPGVWRLGQIGAAQDICAVSRAAIRFLHVNPLEEFACAFSELFGRTSVSIGERLRLTVEEARRHTHGTMLVITESADTESVRLQSSATLCFRSLELTREAVRAFARLDGAFLLDPNGYCHAAGVIVDGISVAETDQDTIVARSRGARFNSARRYRALCDRESRSVLIVVVSEDGYVDLVSTKRKSQADRDGR